MKDRLDVILVQKGLFPSREKAKAAVMAGVVYLDGERVDKAGTAIDETAEVYIKEALCPYVSRGGLKLEKALKNFGIDLNKKVAVDMGASTGGFTDCMLQHGASKVFAIDVGYGQLDWKLRNDSRVVNMEKTNIRYLNIDGIDENIDFISIDVSFISLRLILPVAARLLAESGGMVSLIKPQFEAGREQVGKKGIVRDSRTHKEVIESVIEYGREQELIANELTWSPIKGTKGNIEYLLYFKKSPRGMGGIDVEQIVADSHLELKNII